MQKTLSKTIPQIQQQFSTLEHIQLKTKDHNQIASTSKCKFHFFNFVNFQSKKKWRRRYFVLYSPPDSCIIPGTCDAQLCYYENESLSKECGRIDLKNCEEIISQLETDDFRNVLALKTVFRNQSRIYYLASDTEEELDRWMDKISYVLNISGDGKRFLVCVVSDGC